MIFINTLWAHHTPLSLKFCNFIECKYKISMVCHRISGNAASDRNIHSSVSEQLKKNFAKSRWKVNMIPMHAPPSSFLNIFIHTSHILIGSLKELYIDPVFSHHHPVVSSLSASLALSLHSRACQPLRS